MLFNLYALENTRAQLCAARASTSDEALIPLIRAAWEARGWRVVVKVEIDR